MISSAFWLNRRVLLTGHTGFKGSWLALMLSRLNAQTVGYALDPLPGPGFYDLAKVAGTLTDRRGDIADAASLDAAFDEADPEIVFHLAAQPLVKASYVDPVETYRVNVVGTAQLLDAARRRPGVKAVIVITTDKCYENHGWVWGYRETDRLGGHDPYSNSKACAELVASSFRDSYCTAGQGPLIATARAGNVIGGGDFAADRIVPDAVRAFIAGRPLAVRRPGAVRPWQHVLEPLYGYLLLAEKALGGDAEIASGWNFGPDADSEKDVEALVTGLMAAWGPDARWLPDRTPHPHEAAMLRLDSAKARSRLGWTPLLGFDEMIDWTCRWYRAFAAGADMQAATLDQVDAYLGQRVRLTPLIDTNAPKDAVHDAARDRRRA